MYWSFPYLHEENSVSTLRKKRVRMKKNLREYVKLLILSKFGNILRVCFFVMINIYGGIGRYELL